MDIGNYFSAKTYGHNLGLSAVFRQPNASHSHCQYLHGYALAFKFTFVASSLDENNWVVDFGGLGALKSWLVETFDHKVIVDSNDPKLSTLMNLEKENLAEIVVLDGIGVEKFAKHAFDFADKLVRGLTNGRCWCFEVECFEHGANSAGYKS